LIKDFAISKQSRDKIIGREVLAVIASGLLFPFGLTKSKKKTARQKDQRTIVLIHGYGGNSSCLIPLAKYLRFCGNPTILSFNYQSKHGIDRAARELKTFLKTHVRGGRIDLICHSLGGLIARSYLQDLGGARRVDRCVTLASPHRGTYNAYWIASRIGRELRPDSQILSRLEASKDRANSVQFLSVIAGSDNIVIPRVFAQANENILHVLNLGHLGLLFSPTVFKAVANHLRGLGPELNEKAVVQSV